MVVHYPFPTIVHAAGNFVMGDKDGIASLADEYVNHKGFNTISVGNHDDTAAAMAGSSVYRNPLSTHGDRELPEICANGVVVSAVGWSESGTSFADVGTGREVCCTLSLVTGSMPVWETFRIRRRPDASSARSLRQHTLALILDARYA